MRIRKRLLWVLITIVFLGLVLGFVNPVLSYIAQQRAQKELGKINGTFSTINVNLFTRSITIHDLIWKTPNDSVQNKISLHYARLQGIGLFEILINKQLHAKQLQIDSGAITFSQPQKKDTVQSTSKKSFPLQIERVIVNRVFVEFKQDSVTQIEALLNITYGVLKIDSIHKIQSSLKSVFSHLKGNITSAKIKKSKGYYSSQIEKIEFDSENQSLSIDSLKLIPNYGKYEFAHIKEKQVSRLNLGIQNISIAGLDFHKLFDSLISIQKIAIHGANLHSFRDKRVPFKNGYMDMPMRSLQKLPYVIEIDSITIDSTKITIEEFAEKATQPGKIIFLNLSAAMTRLSNRYYENKPKYSQLDAKANIMGTGVINASFRFPLDDSPLYSAKGKIVGVPLVDLNPILENSAQIRIESGRLSELYFNFNYTDLKSNGTIEINYNDLKLTKLNPDKEKSVDRLQTVLINAFLKKTKDETTEQRKRVGIIDQERDRRRFVFNLWWKSLQSGLKSSVLGNEKK